MVRGWALSSCLEPAGQVRAGPKGTTRRSGWSLSAVAAAVPRPRKGKKAGVADHPNVVRHAGLLIVGPPGMAGLPLS
jgi:hypothetical protein